MSRRIIWILRTVVFVLLIVVAVKPVVVRPDPGLPTSWAVLLDNSLSMTVKDPVQRLDRAKKLIPSLLKSLPRYKLFSFSELVAPLDPALVADVAPNGKETNLAQALQTTFKEPAYRGAVVITDGRQVGTGDAVRAAASIGRPLLLIGVGDRTLFKDVAVRNIQSPPFAFKNVKTFLSAQIGIVGYAGKKVTVRLKQGRKILGLQTLQAAEGEVESTVTFNWTPRTLGTKNLTVEVNEYAGEFTGSNNRKSVSLDVGRDRFRVLYICGMPGPEYGFLRHQFKSDPAVELVTFVILRNASNVVNVPDAELSLIPFPTQDVLINQMASFDLVVFEEFSYRRFGLRPQVLFAIRKKVEEGGSFLVMGGDVMLGPQTDYGMTGVKEMIPVQFGAGAVQTIKGPARFIPKAFRHPILRLSNNPDRNRAIWKNLPELEDITLIPGVKKGATVLGVVKHDGKEYPVLTVWPHGKGRVAVLTSRTTWRFSMLNGRNQDTSFAYQKFWKNMVLWLTHSDEFKSVRVALESKKVHMGDDEPVRVWVYDEYFKPISDVDVRLQITGPDGEQQSLRTHQETAGVFLGSFQAGQLGRYTAQAWVTRKGKKFGRDQVRFQVVESFHEEEDLRPDFDHLKELARATGGRFVTADDFSPEAFEEFNTELSEKVGKKVLLWNSPWFLGSILLFLILEWLLRKMRGWP